MKSDNLSKRNMVYINTMKEVIKYLDNLEKRVESLEKVLKLSH